MLPIDLLSLSVRGKLPSDPTLELGKDTPAIIAADSFQNVFVGEQEADADPAFVTIVLPEESDFQSVAEPAMPPETGIKLPEIARGEMVGIIGEGSSPKGSEIDPLEIAQRHTNQGAVEADLADVSAKLATGTAEPSVPRLEDRVPAQFGGREAGGVMSLRPTATPDMTTPAVAVGKSVPAVESTAGGPEPVTGAITAAEEPRRSVEKLNGSADLPVVPTSNAAALSAGKPRPEVSKARFVMGVGEPVQGRSVDLAEDAAKQASVIASPAGPLSASISAGKWGFSGEFVTSVEASRRQGQPIIDTGPKEFGAVVSSDQATRTVVATPATQSSIPLGVQSNTVAQQVAMQISLQAGTARSKEIELRLEPEELGKLRITILTREAGLTVSIVAERPETLELLKRNSDQLMADLGEKDLGGANLEFSGEEREETGDQAARHTVLVEPESTNVSIAVAEGMTGRLDIRL